MARPHLGGGGEREVLGIDIGRAHQAQQLGGQGRVEARRLVAAQHRRERRPGTRELRGEDESATAGTARPGEIPRLLAQAAEVEMRLGQALVQLDRAFECLPRLSVPA